MKGRRRCSRRRGIARSHAIWLDRHINGSNRGMDMRIIDLDPADQRAIEQTAALLVEGFRAHWPHAWPNMEAALEEVRESFESGRLSRVAVGEDGTVLGWIGGIEQYHGNVWE